MKLFENPPTQHRSTQSKIAIVTGLSDLRYCRLQRPQRAFLEAIVTSVAGDAGRQLRPGLIESNFPFLDEFCGEVDDGTHPRKSLISASVSNLWQYFYSGSKAYRDLSTPHWSRFLASAEKFYIVTGSCGLQLVAEATRYLPPRGSIEILALGPVASKQAMAYIQASRQVRMTVVQGSLDWISKMFFRADCHSVPRLGHMGYWTDPATMEFACNWLSHKISESSGQEATYRNAW